MATRSVFVIGGTGLIGRAVARRLQASGWAVSALARTAQAEARLDQEGIAPFAADLDAALPAVLEHASTVDAVVLAAQLDGPTELALLDGLTPLLVGRTLLFVSGSGVLLSRTGGAWQDTIHAEDDAFTVEPLARDRRRAELVARAAGATGIRTIVVRAGMVWGPGGHGLVPMIYQSVAALGAAGYVGAGRNVYSEVHVDDLVDLVEIALDRGTSGALYHAVGGETPTRWAAEAVARDLGVSSRSLTLTEAEGVWGPFGALIISSTSRITAPRAREELGWTPHHTDLLDEVGDPTLRALAIDLPR